MQNSNFNEDAVKQSINTVRLVYSYYSLLQRKLEIVSKEKDELGKENQALLRQLEDIKQGSLVFSIIMNESVEFLFVFRCCRWCLDFK